MKKAFFVCSFAIAYAVLLSFEIECFLNLLGISIGISLDSQVGMEQYPRFFPFCIIIGVLVFCILGLIFVLDLKVSQRQGYDKKLWCIQIILALSMSIPMIELWEKLFEFLQNKL